MERSGRNGACGRPGESLNRSMDNETKEGKAAEGLRVLCCFRFVDRCRARPIW